jgi:uncharacterized protein YggE
MKKMLVTTVLVISSTLAQGSSIPDFPFVFAAGGAETNVPPDSATMTFYIRAFHETSSNAVATVTTRSIEVIDFLGKQGFDKGSLVTYELSKYEVRERKEDRELKILGYEVTRHFDLTFDDLTKYDLVARTLFKMDNVSDIRTDFGRKNKKEIEAALLTEACADAKRNATAMASGFGKTIGSVHCISKQDLGNLGVVFGLGSDSFRHSVKASMDSGRDAFLFIPTFINFQNQVSVLFKLEEK